MHGPSWRKMAQESNRYFRQHLTERTHRIHERQKRQHTINSSRIVESLREIKTRLNDAFKPIEQHELHTLVGLLTARML